MKDPDVKTRCLRWLSCLLLYFPLVCFSQLSVTNIVPNPACSGQTLLISGSGFTSGTTVEVGGMSQGATFVNPNSILFTLSNVPTGADSIDVRVIEGANSVVDSIFAEAANATFSYLNSPYCLNNVVDPLPNLVDTNALGTFSANSTNISISPTTGEIDLSNSLAGIYTIQFTATTPSGCTDAHFVSVELLDQDTTTINYGGNPTFCASGPDPIPLITGTGGGTFLGTGVVFQNSTTGQIDVSATGNGSFSVCYLIGNGCAGINPCDSVVIVDAGPAGFAYGTVPADYCQGEADPFPMLVGSIPGIFSESTGGLVIDSLSGVVDLGNSAPGTYSIQRVTTVGACTDTAISQFTVTSGPVLQLLSNLKDSVLCEGTPVSFTAFGGNTLVDCYRFWLDGGPDLQFRCGVPDPNVLDTNDLPLGLNLIKASVTNSAGCTSVDSEFVQVNPIPQGIILDAPEVVCGRSRLEILVQSLSDQTSFAWNLRGLGQTVPDFASGFSNPLNMFDSTTIQTTQMITLTDLEPGYVRLSLYPVAAGCVGEIFVDTIRILPNDEQFFIAGAITPDGNGQNDVWEVSWKDGIDPDAYSLEVFNRSGANVITIDALDNTWANIGVPDGAYWYILKRKSDGTILKKAGLVIKRNN